MAKRAVDYRLLAMERELQEKAAKKAKEKGQSNLLKPPRFGRITQQKRVNFADLPLQFKILICKKILENQPQLGRLVKAYEKRDYDTIASICVMHIAGGLRVVIHEWAIDTKPIPGYRACTYFNTIKELIEYVTNEEEEEMFQGDIVTFVLDSNIEEACKKFKGGM